MAQEETGQRQHPQEGAQPQGNQRSQGRTGSLRILIVYYIRLTAEFDEGMGGLGGRSRLDSWFGLNDIRCLWEEAGE